MVMVKLRDIMRFRHKMMKLRKSIEFWKQEIVSTAYWILLACMTHNVLPRKSAGTSAFEFSSNNLFLHSLRLFPSYSLKFFLIHLTWVSTRIIWVQLHKSHVNYFQISKNAFQQWALEIFFLHNRLNKKCKVKGVFTLN